MRCKKSRNGWRSRRQYRREIDREAREMGFRNAREWDHHCAAERLREHLEAGTDEGELFGTAVVADVIDGSPRVVRALVQARLMEATKRPGEKARKLFFTARGVSNFLLSSGQIHSAADLGKAEFAGPFRSEKIAVNRRLNEGVTKMRAAAELGLSKSGVEYQIKRGWLKVLDRGYRTKIVSRASLEALSRQRSRKARREVESLRRKLDLAEKRLKKTSPGVSSNEQLNGA